MIYDQNIACKGNCRAGGSWTVCQVSGGFFSDPSGKYDRCGRHGQLCAGLFPLQFPAGVFDGRHSGGCVQNGFGTSGRRTMQGSRAGVSSFADADVYDGNNRIWYRVSLCRGDRRTVSCTGCVSFDASYGTGTVSGPAGCFLSWIFPGNEQYDPHSRFSNHGADLSCCCRIDDGYVPEG